MSDADERTEIERLNALLRRCVIELDDLAGDAYHPSKALDPLLAELQPWRDPGSPDHQFWAAQSPPAEKSAERNPAPGGGARK